MVAENQEKAFDDMTKEEQKSYIANLSQMPFEKMSKKEREIWIDYLDERNEQLSDQEDAAKEEAERQAEEAEEKAAEEAERQAEEVERQAEEAERKAEQEKELQEARDRVTKATAAMNTPEAQVAHQTLVDAERRDKALDNLQEQLDKTEDEATRKQIEAEIKNLKEEIEANKDKVEAAEALYTPLAKEFRDAREDLADIQQDRLSEMRIPRQEKEEKNDGPNWWQRNMPSLLGGWSSKSLDDWYAKNPETKPGPTWWQRNMHPWIGGWSQEEVDKYDKEHPKAKEVEKPANNGPQKPGMWERMTNAGYQNAQADMAFADSKEVVKGVTVGELRANGWNDEKIYKLQQATVYAQNRSNALNTLNKSGQNITVQSQDYEQAGLSKQDMQDVYKMSQNDQR